MLPTCIKYLFIVSNAFYLYRKLLNLQITKSNFIIYNLISLATTILNYYIRLIFAPGSTLILVILFIISTYLLYKQQLNITIVTSLIAIGSSYVFFVSSSFCMFFLHKVLSKIFNNNNSLYTITVILIGLFQTLLITVLFRFKRLKTGMPFLRKQGSNDICVFIVISLLFAVSLFDISRNYSQSLFIPLFFILLCGILIFFWWKHKLTETYLTKLNERKIHEFEKQIAELRESHDTLAKVIHKDNKLIPTMVFELQNVLTEVGSHLSAEDREAVQGALDKLNALAQERKGMIQFDENKAKAVYSSGSPNIDSLLKYLAAKAYSQQIMFEVMISANVQHILPDIISEADFRTVIADLVENAFIAVKHETKRNVLFHTRIEKDMFYVDIYDSGAPFAKEVLEKMGKEAITTHKNDGGSGIGYMSTFEILNRCNGGLDINENLDVQTYTKRVSIYFDLNVE